MPLKALWYYSHRYGGSPDNLKRAIERFAALEAKWAIKYPDRVLWSPWFWMARAELAEQVSMSACWDDILVSHGLVLDFDGRPLSHGMQAERDAAVFAKKEIIGVDGEDFGEVT